MIIRYNQRTSPTFAALSAFYDYFEESRRLISEAGQAARLEYEEAIRRGGLPEDEEEANSLLAEAVLAEEPYHGIMGTLRYSSVVFLFGIVEHQVRRVLHTNPGSAANAPKRTAAKPQAFLDELLLHLRQSCAAELGTFPEFSRLRNLQIVRDCIAHCNGHVDLSRDKKALLEMSDFKLGSPARRLRHGIACVEKNQIRLEDEFIKKHIQNSWQFFLAVFRILEWDVDANWSLKLHCPRRASPKPK